MEVDPAVGTETDLTVGTAREAGTRAGTGDAPVVDSEAEKQGLAMVNLDLPFVPSTSALEPCNLSRKCFLTLHQG